MAQIAFRRLLSSDFPFFGLGLPNLGHFHFSILKLFIILPALRLKMKQPIKSCLGLDQWMSHFFYFSSSADNRFESHSF